MVVAIHSTLRLPLSQRRMRAFVECAQRQVRFSPNYELSIVLVGPTRMQRLNQEYRGKAQPTNVLSFSYDALHGEIVLCPAVIKPQAKAKQVSFSEELLYLLGHGLLHLKGMDHEQSARAALRMEAVEDKLMQVCYR